MRLWLCHLACIPLTGQEELGEGPQGLAEGPQGGNKGRASQGATQRIRGRHTAPQGVIGGVKPGIDLTAKQTVHTSLIKLSFLPSQVFGRPQAKPAIALFMYKYKN